MAGALREILAEFGVKVDDRELQKADGTIARAVGGIKALGAALVGGLFVRGVASFVTGSIHMGEEIDALSKRLGLSVADVQRWQLAARQANVPAEALAASIGILNRQAAEAARGGDISAEFTRLGVALKNADGSMRSTDEVLTDVGAAIGEIPDHAERTRVAMTLLGRGGAALLPLFARGREGIEEMKAQLDELGGGLSEEFVHDAEQAGREISRFEVVMEGFRSMLAVAFLPIVTRVLTGIVRLGASFVKLAKDSNIVKAALVVLGVAAAAVALKMLAAFAVPIAIFAAIALGIAAIVLLVDELITLFQGGDTVLGQFIDKMFGVGASEKFVRDVKAAWEDLKVVIGVVKDVIEAFLVDLPAKIDTIVADFTTGWNAIRDGFGAAMDWITARWEQFVSFIRPTLELLNTVFGKAGVLEQGGRQRGLQGGPGQRFIRGLANTPEAAAFAGGVIDSAGTGQSLASQGAVSGSRRQLNNIDYSPRTDFHVTVQEAFNARETGRVVSQEVARIVREQNEAALAALAPEVPGSGFEDEVQLESGGEE